MRALYGDRGTEAAYETLSGRAIELIWELLTTDRGTRKRPDLEAIREHQEALRAIEAQLQRCQEQTALIHAGERMPLPAKRVSQQPPSGASQDELLRMVHRQNEDSAESQDQLHLRLDRAETVLRELHRLSTADQILREKRDSLVLELAELVYDESRWELIPDSEPAGAERLQLSLRALLAGEDELPPRPALEEPAAVRDWLTFPEFSWAVEHGSRSTTPRWAEGRSLPREAHRRPWDADAIPIDDSLGRGYRRIWVPGVRETFWPTEGARQRVAALLRRWPEKQGWSRGSEPGRRCLEDLVLPEPFAAQRAERSSK